ncbi:MAG: hypothetical protein KF867_02355 [Cryobacterium sp.]|nr:hypothetical protein [Cryobacterium sp.]
MPPTWDSIDLGFNDLDGDAPEEQMGSKDKWWIRLDGDDRPWLVKIARTDSRDGTVSGEDWAEWIVQHLAAILGVPAATIRPATFDGDRAIMSRSVLKDANESLSHGNEVLGGRFPDYDQSVKGENPGYTVEAVRESLHDVQAPSDAPELVHFSGFDAFAGYLLLDAWVSGRDRHHENWGVIQRGSERRLAPSFDHGNALGFQLRDPKRKRILDDPDHLQRWLERGASQHFVGRPGLVVLAHQALDLTSPFAREYWLRRLAELDESAVEDAVTSVPLAIMSEVSRRFIARLLNENRRRLLNGHSVS